MTENKDLTLAERREWALEAAAKDLGISVGEFKRRLSIEREIKRARARGAAEWEIEAIKNCPTSFIQDVVRDNQAPKGPSAECIIPTSQQVSQVRVGGGSGWQRHIPLRNGIGQGK